MNIQKVVFTNLKKLKQFDKNSYVCGNLSAVTINTQIWSNNCVEHSSTVIEAIWLCKTSKIIDIDSLLKFVSYFLFDKNKKN